jgi:hypothetical protein
MIQARSAAAVALLTLAIASPLAADELEEAKIYLDVTSFAVPDGWLQPGIEYELGVATVSESGNLSFQEIAFITAP